MDFVASWSQSERLLAAEQSPFGCKQASESAVGNTMTPQKDELREVGPLNWEVGLLVIAAEPGSWCPGVYGFDLLTTMDTKLEEIRKDTKALKKAPSGQRF